MEASKQESTSTVYVMGWDGPGMGREGGALELGSCLVMGRYMELAVSGNHSFSYSNSSLLSFTQKAERSVDSGTRVLPRLLVRPLCSTQIQGS